MSEDDSFHDLVGRLRDGENTAVQELFRRFTAQLIALAQRQFDAVVRGKVDVEDVVQSAYKSFFVRFQEGTVSVASWNSLWGLLTLIVLRKCLNRVEYFRAQRRDARREISVSAADASGPAWD